MAYDYPYLLEKGVCMLEKVNDEVYLSKQEITQLSAEHIAFIRAAAVRSKRGRARICCHNNNDEKIHEMIIGILGDSYIRPHKHIGKIESFHLVDGQADVVIFNDSGDILEVVELGFNKNFYYRLNIPSYHTVLVKSDILVIHEITNGPFNADESEYASFSPSEDDPSHTNYMDELIKKVVEWKSCRDQ